MNPLDDVLTREQQQILRTAIEEAKKGLGYGLVYLDVHKGIVRHIFGGRSYDATPDSLNPAAVAVKPMGKRRRRE